MINTIVYVVKGQKQSLLGLLDGEALGIIKINPDGDQCVRQLQNHNKLDPPEINSTDESGVQNIEEIIERYNSVFHGIGRARVEPIHIFTEPNTAPRQQKQRPIALHFRDKFKVHIELKEGGVVEGPLEPKAAIG